MDLLIKNLEKYYNVSIVLYSSWKTFFSVEELKDLFSLYSFGKKIVDKTENCTWYQEEVSTLLEKNPHIENNIVFATLHFLVNVTKEDCLLLEIHY